MTCQSKQRGSCKGEEGQMHDKDQLNVLQACFLLLSMFSDESFNFQGAVLKLHRKRQHVRQGMHQRPRVNLTGTMKNRVELFILSKKQKNLN